MMSAQNLPLNIVGSSTFGRYPKISQAQTWNMIISDGFLVPSAGYKLKAELSVNGVGRGIFTSTRAKKMIAIIGNMAFVIDPQLNFSPIGTLETFSGDVFMDENDNNQIAICDKNKIYIYKYLTGEFITVVTDFTPGYIAFQDGYFIAPVIGTNVGSGTWRLSALNDGTSWPFSASTVGTFQTKPDQPVACIRFPGRGNLLFVMGTNVTEIWNDIGNFPYPYQRNSSTNIDYGCINPATIAFGDSFVVWIGVNEKMGPVILYSTGGEAQQISTDGINFKLAHINNPSNSFGFLFKQDGHLLYQFTFNDPADQLTFVYDFTTQKLFNFSNETMDAHIAKKVSFFNDTYYFVSTIDGNLYELSSVFTNYDYSPNPAIQTIVNEIPRIRICDTFRLPDTSPFITNNLSFILEEGEPNVLSENYLQQQTTNLQAIQSRRVDLSISIDGGETFGSAAPYFLNPPGKRRNRIQYWRLGYANEMTTQFRFWGFQRFVVGDGIMKVYQ